MISFGLINNLIYNQKLDNQLSVNNYCNNKHVIEYSVTCPECLDM